MRRRLRRRAAARSPAPDRRRRVAAREPAARRRTLDLSEARNMIALEDPPGFVVRTEAQKAASDNGFRIERGVESGGWLRYSSTTAHGEIWFAGASPRGPWLLSIDHPGVAAELATLPASPAAAPGLATFEFASLTALHAALDRVYKLGVSLPDAPLARCRTQTARLPVILRVFEGCARAYFGRVDGANVVKMNRLEPRISYLTYLPLRTTRIRCLRSPSRSIFRLSGCELGTIRRCAILQSFIARRPFWAPSIHCAPSSRGSPLQRSRKGFWTRAPK
jgi:hypothetical protein